MRHESETPPGVNGLLTCRSVEEGRGPPVSVLEITPTVCVRNYTDTHSENFHTSFSYIHRHVKICVLGHVYRGMLRQKACTRLVSVWLSMADCDSLAELRA